MEPDQAAEARCERADPGTIAGSSETAGLSETGGQSDTAGLSEMTGLSEAAGMSEMTGLDETGRRRALVAQTARFTAAFLRWTDGRSCGGLTYTRLRLLEALHCGGPAIMRDLGVQLGVSPRNMTAMVDALEDAQLVVRRPHPTDRRATLVELSPSGALEAEQALEPRLDAMAELFEGFSAAEQQAFADALARLGQAMQDRQDSC